MALALTDRLSPFSSFLISTMHWDMYWCYRGKRGEWHHRGGEGLRGGVALRGEERLIKGITAEGGLRGGVTSGERRAG